MPAVLALAFALLAAVVFASPARSAGPCRIAVTGAFPTGYVGLLARHGMPRDILLEYQLSDPEVLARYDLVIVAGASPNIGRDAVPALERVLAQGGSVLIDYSIAGRGVMDFLLQPGTAMPLRGRRVGLPLPMMARAPFRLEGAANPLAAGVAQNETFPASRVGISPEVTDPANSTVLATYTAATTDPRVRQARPGQRPTPEERLAPKGAPAIVLQKRGSGKLLLCGPGVGISTALSGTNYDPLILGMLNLLSEGRAVPQLAPEGPRLGRKQSMRSRGEEESADAADSRPEVAPASEWPAGPGKPSRLPAGVTALEEEPAPEFNITGRFTGGTGEVLLNYWNASHHLRVSLGDTITVTRYVAGKPQRLGASKTRIAPNTPFVIKERRDRLIVMAGGATVTAGLNGLFQGPIGLRGGIKATHYQPVEPAYFSDDFMRTSEESGGWETHGGTWQTAPVQNPEMGANPFSYKVEATTPATALVGYPYWDEYRFSVSLRAESAAGYGGVGIYAQDARNMLLFRARIHEGGTPPADGFALVRLVNGQPKVLAQAAGGLVPRQWYRVQVKAEGPWIGVFVDGERVLVARETAFLGGQAALYAEGSACRFDDTLVEPASTPAVAGQRLVGYVPEFAGIIDVDSWAGPATPWEADAATPGLFWRRGAFYGDTGMRFAVPALPEGGQAMLLLDGDGQTTDSGYSLALRREGSTARLELCRAGKVVAQAPAPTAALALGLRRDGQRVLALVEGRVVLSAPYAPEAGGGRLAFRVSGFQPPISSLAVWSANLRDFTFDSAPVDWWIGSGEWDVTNRWSCTPDWSWFGGVSENIASIWYKQPLQGDAVLDFYAGPKMIQNARGRSERVGDFNAALCCESADIDSGYAFVVGAENGGAQIRRKGQVVAQNSRFQFFRQGHNRWANVRVEKRGARIQLYAEGQLVVEYTDPEPLAGGYAGVWTQRNGIMVPRISLYFENVGKRLLSLP